MQHELAKFIILTKFGDDGPEDFMGNHADATAVPHLVDTQPDEYGCWFYVITSAFNQGVSMQDLIFELVPTANLQGFKVTVWNE